MRFVYLYGILTEAKIARRKPGDFLCYGSMMLWSDQAAMFMKTCATMARVAVPAGLKALLEPERYFSAVQ